MQWVDKCQQPCHLSVQCKVTYSGLTSVNNLVTCQCTHLSVLLGDGNVSSVGLQLMVMNLLEHVTVLHTESETKCVLKVVSLILLDILKAFSN